MPSFTCPNCQKVLKSNNPIAPGKKIKCPSCTKIFVMPAADEEAITAKKPVALARKPAPAVTAGNAAQSKKRRPDPDEEAPRQSSQKAKARADEDNEDQDEEDLPIKKKKKSKKAGSKRGLLIALGAGGGVLLLVVFLGFIWPGFFVSNDGGKVAKGGTPKKFTAPKAAVEVDSGEPIDIMTLIPENCEFIAGANLGVLLKAPGGLQGFQQGIAGGGAPPAVANILKNPNRFVIAGQIPSNDVPNQPVNIIAAFTSNEPLDPKEVQAAFNAGPAQKVQGKTLYKLNNPAAPSASLILPNNQSIVFGTMPEAGFIKILEGQGKLPTDLQNHVSTLHQRFVWAVVNWQAVVKNKAFDLSALKEMPGGPEAAAALGNAKFAAFSIDIDVANKKIRLQSDLHCATDQDAAQVETFAAKVWEDNIKPLLGSIGPQLNQFGIANDSVKLLTDNLNETFKIDKQGATVSVSLSLSENILSALNNAKDAPGNAIPKKASKAKKK
jgi:hypothetical protein